jgi:hypothetical protein
MRLGLLVGLLAACGPHKRPSEPVSPNADKLRFRAAPGEEPRDKVSLQLEAELGRGGAASKHVTLGFDFTMEQKIEAVGQDGAVQVYARPVDVVGKGGIGIDQKAIDEFALRIDELRINFRRTARGEISNLAVTGIRPPMEEYIARGIVNGVFNAGRGSLFPEEPVEPGATWRVKALVPTPFGFQGEVNYTYTISRKMGNAVLILGEGSLEGKGKQGGMTRQLSGKSTTEFRFETENGKMIHSTVDTQYRVDDLVPPSMPAPAPTKMRVRVESGIPER